MDVDVDQTGRYHSPARHLVNLGAIDGQVFPDPADQAILDQDVEHAVSSGRRVDHAAALHNQSRRHAHPLFICSIVSGTSGVVAPGQQIQHRHPDGDAV